MADMENRLKKTEDIEEINKLHCRYVNLLMDNKWDEIMELFSENPIAIMTETHKGRAAIEKWLKQSVARFHIGKEGDFIVHPNITVEGDKAKGNWLLYMMWAHPRTLQSLFWNQGYYDCEYVRENGKWKFNVFQWKLRLGPPGLPPTIDYLNNFPGNS
jgi:hypothetical protein